MAGRMTNVVCVKAKSDCGATIRLIPMHGEKAEWKL
jgi:hypothetical protein